MTTLSLELPDEMAEAIRSKGLLTPAGVTELLREALSSQAMTFIADFARETEARGIAPLSDKEMAWEIHSARKETLV
jgi:hypothetical protein